MNYYILQSLLLLGIAYIAGAIIGCVLRKLFRKSGGTAQEIQASARPDDLAVAAGVAAGGGGAAIAARRLAGNEREASIEIKRSEARVEDALAPLREEEPASAVSPPQSAGPSEAPAREIITIVDRPLAGGGTTVSDDDKQSAINVAVASAGAGQSDVDVVRETAAIGTVSTPPALDDLTRIKGVGLPVALELKKRGITRFQQIAAWTDADVAGISRELGFSGRIERENWMDQAKILAAGDDVAFTSHQFDEAERRKASEAGVEIVKAADAGTAASSSAASSSASLGAETGDDLKRIHGIGTNLEQQLNALGVTRFAQIAAWSPRDIQNFSDKLEIVGRIDREKWVHQARLLANNVT